MAKESFRERQMQELEAIKVRMHVYISYNRILIETQFIFVQSIFGSDVEDLRPYDSSSTPSQWKPTDIRIMLTPLRDSSNGVPEAYVRTKLHVVCPSKYPKL